MTNIEYVYYNNYGQCVEIDLGKTRCIITVEFGPRIVFFGIGNQNILRNEIDFNRIQKNGEFFDKNFGKDTAWHFYGGHRFWRGEESLESYFPDNKPVKVKILKNGAVFGPVRQQLYGISTELKVTVNEKNEEFEILHTLKNSGAASIKMCAWGITALTHGGVCVIPLCDKDMGFLPNRHISLWSYTDLADKRILLSNKYLILRHDPKAMQLLKIGAFNSKGFAAYANKGLLFVKRIECFENETYPDGGCNFESYLCNDYIELETLSPLKTVPSGEEINHTEKWSVSLFDKDVPKISNDADAEAFLQEHGIE